MKELFKYITKGFLHNRRLGVHKSYVMSKLTLGGPEIGHSVHTLEFPLLVMVLFMAETLDFHAQSNEHISMNNKFTIVFSQKLRLLMLLGEVW